MNIKGIFRKPERFTNYDPDSPAERAARKWDEREGEIVVQNQNLRLLLAGMMVVAICLTGGLVYKSMASAVMPYVVEVDTTTGAVRNIGTVAASAEYTPGEAVYKYFLAKFLKNTREIPLDPVVYKENLTTAYGYLTKDASTKLQTMLRTERTTEKFGHQTVQINVSTILPMEGGHSYQIRWTEEEFIIGTGEKTITPGSHQEGKFIAEAEVLGRFFASSVSKVHGSSSAGLPLLPSGWREKYLVGTSPDEMVESGQGDS